MRLGLSANTCGLLQSFPRIYLKKIMKNFVHDSQSLARLKSHTNICNFSQMDYYCGNSINQSNRKFNTCVSTKYIRRKHHT